MRARTYDGGTPSTAALAMLTCCVLRLQDSEVRTGKMGFGNKGAVMVRMRVFDEPVAAVCAHLASGEAPADALKRQADFMQICRTGAFGGAAEEGQTILHAPLEVDPRYDPPMRPPPPRTALSGSASMDVLPGGCRDVGTRYV